jgi:hypothetical protein
VERANKYYSFEIGKSSWVFKKIVRVQMVFRELMKGMDGNKKRTEVACANLANLRSPRDKHR